MYFFYRCRQIIFQLSDAIDNCSLKISFLGQNMRFSTGVIEVICIFITYNYKLEI